jgi:hypothetical protein
VWIGTSVTTQQRASDQKTTEGPISRYYTHISSKQNPPSSVKQQQVPAVVSGYNLCAIYSDQENRINNKPTIFPHYPVLPHRLPSLRSIRGGLDDNTTITLVTIATVLQYLHATQTQTQSQSNPIQSNHAEAGHHIDILVRGKEGEDWNRGMGPNPPPLSTYLLHSPYYSTYYSTPWYLKEPERRKGKIGRQTD